MRSLKGKSHLEEFKHHVVQMGGHVDHRDGLVLLFNCRDNQTIQDRHQLELMRYKCIRSKSPLNSSSTSSGEFM